MSDEEMERAPVRPGDVVEIRALKAHGEPYRRWRATVESLGPDWMVTRTRAGNRVSGPGGGWEWKHDTRGVYWFDRPYNLTEVYDRGGRIRQIYIHIASPATVEDRTVVYTDHELDVDLRPGQAPRVRDEDEFAAAVAEYGYSPQFQASCRQAVEEALELAGKWFESRLFILGRADRHAGNRLQDAQH